MKQQRFPLGDEGSLEMKSSQRFQNPICIWYICHRNEPFYVGKYAIYIYMDPLWENDIGSNMKRNDWNSKALWMALQISPYQPRIGVFRAPFFRAAWRMG